MIAVKGIEVDDMTKCRHYHSDLDIIAIKFKCCHFYYSCYQCHQELTDHATETWNRNEYDHLTVLCGSCRTEMTIDDYLDAKHICPDCDAKFNPGCQYHYNLYFD